MMQNILPMTNSTRKWQTEMRNYYSILTWPALQLGDFEDWSIVAFTRSFISCNVCNPFEEMSSAAIASNISPMSSISSMLFVFLAAIWMRFRLNLRKIKFKTKLFDCEKSYFPWFLWYKSIVNSHSKNWRIWGGVTEIRGVRVSYNSVQLPRKAVCVYWENNTTLRLVLTIVSAA